MMIPRLPVSVIYNEVRQYYSGNLFLAFDFDTCQLSKDKELVKHEGS